jgi:hypothetical protein
MGFILSGCSANENRRFHSVHGRSSGQTASAGGCSLPVNLPGVRMSCSPHDGAVVTPVLSWQAPGARRSGRPCASVAIEAIGMKAT